LEGKFSIVGVEVLYCGFYAYADVLVYVLKSFNEVQIDFLHLFSKTLERKLISISNTSITL
jgi:hypothetical protein